MSKRKLNYLNFDDVIVPISLVLIESWIDSGSTLETMSTVASVFGDGMDTDKMNEPPTLDKDFLTSLRDLKVRSLKVVEFLVARCKKNTSSHPDIYKHFICRHYKNETRNIEM